MQILLIEDNQTIIKGLTYYFTKTTYQLDYATTITDAKKYLQTNTPDLIILDITLPDRNGTKFYKDTLKSQQLKTFFLTAQDDEDQIVELFNLGIEDYMTKPFSTKELLARINKILLRNNHQHLIHIKDLTYDLNKMTIQKNNLPLELTPLETKLLNLLFQNTNKVISRTTILDKIWEWTGNDVDDHTITVYFKRIREKLGTNIIKTVKGIGYIIETDK